MGHESWLEDGCLDGILSMHFQLGKHFLIVVLNHLVLGLLLPHSSLQVADSQLESLS